MTSASEQAAATGLLHFEREAYGARADRAVGTLSESWLAMCWGHSVLVTEPGVERLSRHPLDLVETG